MSFVHKKITLIDCGVGVSEFAFAVTAVFVPLSLVAAAILPLHHSISLSFALEPLALVGRVIKKFYSRQLDWDFGIQGKGNQLIMGLAEAVSEFIGAALACPIFKRKGLSFFVILLVLLSLVASAAFFMLL